MNNNKAVRGQPFRPPSTQSEGTMQTAGNTVMQQRGVQRRPPAPRHALNCNKCCQPLTTTVWVCACNCTFCDDCAKGHFGTSHNCPVCNVKLKDDHLVEIVVAEPPSEGSETNQLMRQENLQGYFKKTNPNLKCMTFDVLCHRLLRQQEDSRQGITYVLKQASREMSLLKHHLAKHKRAVSTFKQQTTTLQQELNNQKLQYEKQLDKQRLEYEKRMGDMKHQLDEKENLIVTFRQRYGGGGGGTVCSNGSGGAPEAFLQPQQMQRPKSPHHLAMQQQQQQQNRHRRKSPHQSSMQQQQEQNRPRKSPHHLSMPQQRQKSPHHPPMKQYLYNKEVEEHEKRQALTQGSRPIMGTAINSNGKRPNPGGSGGVVAGDWPYPSSRSYPQNRLQQHQQELPTQVGPKGPRGTSVGIRTNLTQHESFPSSTSGNQQMNKRRRRASPGGLIPRHSQGSNISPSQAFGDEPNGGHNTSVTSSQYREHQRGRRSM